MTWARARPTPFTAGAYASPVEWYLVYSDFQERHWFARMFRKGFQHVTAVKRDGRLWIEVNQNICFVDVTVERSDISLEALYPGMKIQRVVSYRSMEGFRYPWLVGAVSCVELVKGLLGIRTFALWTPHQLFRYIERRKGVLECTRPKPQSPHRKISSSNSARPTN